MTVGSIVVSTGTVSVGTVVSDGTVVSTGRVVSTGGATVVVTNTQLTSGICSPDDGESGCG